MLFFQEPFSEFGLGIVYSYVYISQCRKKVVDRGGGGGQIQSVSFRERKHSVNIKSDQSYG